MQPGRRFRRPYCMGKRMALNIFQLKSHSCRWMVSQRLYCGAEAESFARPYCSAHKVLVYEKRRKGKVHIRPKYSPTTKTFIMRAVPTCQ